MATNTLSPLSIPDPEKSKPVDNFFIIAGVSYTFGVVGASSAHFLKAFCSSPNGQRFISGIHRVRNNAHRSASSFAFWAGGVLSAFEVGAGYLRKKDDAWNGVIAGTATGMLYRMRRGFVPASKMGLGCAAAGCVVDAAVYASHRTFDIIGEQLSSGRTELSIMEPFLDSTAEWFRVLLGCGAAKVEDASTEK